MFVGYKMEVMVMKVLKYFDKMFIDTSRVEV